LPPLAQLKKCRHENPSNLADNRLSYARYEQSSIARIIEIRAVAFIRITRWFYRLDYSMGVLARSRGRHKHEKRAQCRKPNAARYEQQSS
jgi:hypothetical protein